MASPLDTLLSAEAQADIVGAIAAAERGTAGEIKVHVEARCPVTDPYQRAVELFARLGMQRTRGRTGVLVYVAAEQRRFAVIGDSGVHAVVEPGFWDAVASQMVERFRSGAIGDGIVAGIRAIGELLHAKLPVEAEPSNELDDAISTGEPPAAPGKPIRG